MIDMTAILTKDEIKVERVAAMARVFTRVNRVLSGEDITCTTVHDDGMGAPAWSDGETVTFNMAKINSVTSVDDIIAITGLNYHELAHILFTPRKGSKVVHEVLSKGLFHIFNVLEDQRIETLLTGMYPATAPYFTTTVMKYILEYPEADLEMAHVLLHGRKYLPKSIRDTFAASFKMQSKIVKVNAILDEYRLLNSKSTTDQNRMPVLVEELARLLMGEPVPPSPFGHSSSGTPSVNDRKEVTKGQPMSKDEQDDAKEYAEVADEDRELDEKEEAEKVGESQPSDEDGDAADDTDGAGDGDEDGDGEDADDDFDAGSTGDAEGEGEGESEGDGGDGNDADGDLDASDEDDAADGNKAGVGGGSVEAPDADDIRKQLQDAIDSVMNDEGVQSDVKGRQQAIQRGDGNISGKIDVVDSTEVPVEGWAKNAAKKFAGQLDRLRMDVDPGWKQHKSSGRVNVKRVMQGHDFDTVFDQWEEGASDRSDIEAVLYVDFSSSMGSVMSRACEALWVIKRALETVNANVTVYAFNSESWVIYPKDEKAAPGVFRTVSATGGTNPKQAILESMRVFHNSRKHTKMAVWLTDGEWSDYSYFWGNEGAAHYTDDRGNDELVEVLTKAGVYTATAFLIDERTLDYYKENGQEPELNQHGCRYGRIITNPSDLIPFAKHIVDDIMKGA